MSFRTSSSLLLTLVLGLSACTQMNAPPVAPSAMTPAVAASRPVADWEPVKLPGKRLTRYSRETVEGRAVWRADAEQSASMWRRRWHVPAAELGHIRFSWKVDQLIAGAALGQADHDDAPARIVVAFDGDHGRLSPKNRMLFELADSLTGERPPYATLMYVWSDGLTAPESVLHSPRTDRIRKIVLESGPQHLGQWRLHRRDLAADYQRAFGEAPGDVLGIALMTDSDNTQGSATAWYGDIQFEGPARSVSPDRGSH